MTLRVSERTEPDMKVKSGERNTLQKKIASSMLQHKRALIKCEKVPVQLLHNLATLKVKTIDFPANYRSTRMAMGNFHFCLTTNGEGNERFEFLLFADKRGEAESILKISGLEFKLLVFKLLVMKFQFKGIV